MWHVKAYKVWNDIFREFNGLSNTYFCGHKILHLIERDLQALFINQIVTKNIMRRFKPYVVMNMLSPIKRASFLKNKVFNRDYPVNCLSEKPLWETGEFVFIPQIENNLNSMIPIANNLDQSGISVRFLLPPKYSGWKKLTILNSSIKNTVVQGYNKRYSIDLDSLNSFLCEFEIFLKPRRDINIFLKRLLIDSSREYIESFMTATEQIKSNIRTRPPAIFLTARPKRLHPISYIVAAKDTGFPTVYVAHSTWFKKKEFLGQMYDLKSFTAAIAFTESCKMKMMEDSPALKVIVSGWPKINHSNLSFQAKSSISIANDITLNIGYTPGKDYEVVRQISTLADLEGVKILMKSHPPGDNVKYLRDAIGKKRLNKIILFDHNEVGLIDFLAMIDILICGKSNTGLEAAGLGIPIIGFYSSNENASNDYVRRIIEAPDISLWQAGDMRELINLIKKLRHTNIQKKEEWSSMQIDNYRQKFPIYDVDIICNKLKNIAGLD